MNFISLEFLVFFPVVLGCTGCCREKADGFYAGSQLFFIYQLEFMDRIAAFVHYGSILYIRMEDCRYAKPQKKRGHGWCWRWYSVWAALFCLKERKYW